MIPARPAGSLPHECHHQLLSSACCALLLEKASAPALTRPRLRPAGALNCLGDADRFLRSCHTRAEFALLKYVPAPLVALSGLVAGPDRCAPVGRPSRGLVRPCGMHEDNKLQAHPAAAHVHARSSPGWKACAHPTPPRSSSRRPQLQWPRAAFDSQRRLAGNLTTLRGWMLGVAPAALAATSGRRQAG